MMSTQISDRDDAAKVSTATGEPDYLAKIETRIDGLREQVNFAIQALRMSERELEAITESLSGRMTT